jgi:sugar lactone lactonase YvrE
METVQHLLSVRNRLGEGPLWHTGEQSFYWVDIEGHAYQRYSPASGSVSRQNIEWMLGVMRFRQSGGMVMATSDGIKFWDPLAQRIEHLTNPEPGKPNARFNDGGIDPQGRFWAGTMCPGSQTSSLYRLDADHTLHCMQTGVGISNGIGWSPDGTVMYFTDSPAKVIYAYDFDGATGNITHRRNFIVSTVDVGFPDGLAVDAEGCLWSARWGGWKISRYLPDGQLDFEIPMPVEFPTAVAFGGEDLSDLYITSAWTELGEEHKDSQPWSGDVFLLHAGIRGQAEPFYKG